MELILPILGLLLALVESFLFYKAIRNTRRARLLTTLPLSSIREMQAGLVKVEGRAVALHGTMRSPLADRDCVYFRFQVQEKRRRHMGPHGGGGAYWKTVINDAQALPCAIEDGVHVASLEIESAELVLRPDEEERSGFLNTARRELEDTLRERYGYSSVGLIFNRNLYYSETRIEEGDELLVLGTARQTANDGWELVRADGPLIVSNLGLAALQASYRNAATGWWIVSVLAIVVVAAAVIAAWLL